MKWNLISMGDIALYKGGSVDPRKHQDEVFELYSIPAFDAGSPEVVAGSEIGSPKKAVQPNDVMISRIVPHIRRAWVVEPFKSHRQIASGEWIIFRNERIWPQYLRWVLVGGAFHSAFLRTVSGVGGSLLRARPAEVYKIQIPFPPLADQRRIAGILDAADALRAKRRESLSQLDALLHSIFLHMFGDLVTNPMGWEVATIGEVTMCLDRLRKPVKEADRISGDIPYYGANGQQGWINEALFDEPLVLVAEDGGHFGDPARGVAYRIDGPSWVNNHAHVLRPSGTIDVEYLHRALRHYDFGPYISGSTRSKLNQKQLNRARLPLPPLDLQHRFAAIVESVERQRATQRSHLAELDTLFSSLESRAFTGAL